MYLINQNSDIIVVDVETTGTDPARNAVILIAVAVCDHLMQVKHQRVFRLRPHIGAEIEPKALQINGLLESDFAFYAQPAETLKELNSWLHACCYGSPRFAMWFCWGVGFDDKFLFKAYERAGVPHYMRYTWVCMRGLATYLNLMSSVMLEIPNCETKKVSKFLEFLGEKFKGAEHDPMADVLNSIRVVRLFMARVIRSARCEKIAGGK